MFKEGARLALAGTAAGLVLSLFISTLLSRIAILGNAPSPWVWIAGPVVLAGVVALASAAPARRSLMVDPLHALRED